MIRTCACGRRMSRFAFECTRCAAATRAARIAEALRIVATHRCPDCEQPLVRNNSMAGWWQCSGYGAEGFRQPGATHCTFQTFTE